MKINWTTSCAPQPDFKSSPIPKVVLATGCVGGECAGGAAWALRAMPVDQARSSQTAGPANTGHQSYQR